MRLLRPPRPILRHYPDSSTVRPSAFKSPSWLHLTTLVRYPILGPRPAREPTVPEALARALRKLHLPLVKRRWTLLHRRP